MLRAAFVIAVTFPLATSPAMAAAAWTGGDDLPTSPLACDATPAKASAKPYDGGSPKNPPSRKGKKISVVDVPKLIGIGYFNATSKCTTPNQARWIAEMSAYATKCHSKMKWLETVEAQEDNVLSFNQATTLINKYGGDLKGLFGMTSVATPASAEAVTQAKKCGQVAVIGLATPNAMKPYVNKDCVKSVVLWNPVDLGYAAVHVLRAVADGTLKPGATSVKAGKLGELQVINGSEILLGPPFVFTKSNINGFDF